MRLPIKLLVTAVAAATLVASLTAAACARNLSISTRNIRVQFEPLVFQSSIATVSCRVTLEGSFNCATVSKVESAQIGYLSRATSAAETCRSSGGFSVTARFQPPSLPWTVTYVGYLGRLPMVLFIILLERTRIELNNVPLIGTCNYTARIEAFITGRSGNAITESAERENKAFLRPDETRRIRSETGGCPEFSLASSRPEPLWQLGTTTAARARLT
jgi:hypothetical protein